MTLVSRKTVSCVHLLVLLLLVGLCRGFTPKATTTRSFHHHLAKGDRESPELTNNPFTKASWYAVEAFGKVFGTPVKNVDDSELMVIDRSRPPSSMEETIQRLKEDNDRQYFLSGTIDELIYDEDCTFSDPFVSFQGRKRFVENLQNLGSFITQYSAKPLDYTQNDTDGTTVVQTKFMVKLQLNLPWKPVLAWPWGVVCTIDPETKLITKHQEVWDIAPWEGVKQIFRKPTTSV
ncbi:hypothetical protein FisN_3Lu526 [Fistulifera solaris]|uniref:SnoaL-like domain-containing protein n=1 Tax=Fistulifera solaris TaxID=1519565 RepID=A0A1Z5J976_FISSO|nr:hypothetical protein FisN_3Lu526 [Fistulifera solaris]|eukprot:GAX10321.1 hypothetical protein FisN_3Lu526 [Fistulifera solaris]